MIWYIKQIIICNISRDLDCHCNVMMIVILRCMVIRGYICCFSVNMFKLESWMGVTLKSCFDMISIGVPISQDMF